MNKNWFKITVKVVIVLCIIAAGYYGIQKYSCQSATQAFEKVKSEVTMQADRIEEDTKLLTTLLETEKHLSNFQLATVYRWLSNINLIQYKYEKFLEFAEKAVFYAGKADSNELIVTTYLNVANMFTMLEYGSIAVQMLEKVEPLLDTLTDKDIKVRATEYLHYYYSWAYTGLGDGEKVLDHIDYDFQLLSDSTIYFNIIIQLLKAEAQFDIGDINGAKDTLLHINELYKEVEDLEHTQQRINNVECPLYTLRTELYLVDGNLDLAIKEAQAFLEYSGQYFDDPIIFFRNFFRIFNQQNFQVTEEQHEVLDSFKEILVTHYPNTLQTARTTSGDFILNTFFSSVENMKYNDNAEMMGRKTLYGIIIFLVIVLCFMFVLNSSHNQSRKDELTGLYNRRHFNKRIQKLQNNNLAYHIVMFDIDYFKRLNDTYGHEFGDTVLKKLSKQIGDLLSSQEQFFRYGGEEFCIITKKNDKEDVLTMAEQVRVHVEQLTWEHDLTVTISMGIAHSTESPSAIKVADDRLYHSKENGRNTITFS